MADLTSTEVKSGVATAIISTLVLGGVLFLFSFIAHDYTPPAKGHPPAHGHPAPKPAHELYPADSPVLWVSIIPTLGLAALPPVVALIVGLVIGLLYGIETALSASYDLSKPLHVLALLLDLTWSLANTLFGFVFGNIIYMIASGLPDRDQSRAKTWLSWKGAFHSDSGSVLQTLGPFNLGGEGAHEFVHLIQARIFGPSFLPLQLVNYVVNGLIQILWTITLGWILALTKVRDSAWFRPSRDSAVRTADGQTSGAADFFGWIYRYTIMELWAYATQ